MPGDGSLELNHGVPAARLDCDEVMHVAASTGVKVHNWRQSESLRQGELVASASSPGPPRSSKLKGPVVGVQREARPTPDK